MAVKFGKYILLSKIATGGMAEVFRAKHIGVGGFEKIVAIKRILPHFSNNNEFITMFNEEAKVSAQLSHQNIVQIYEFGMAEKSYYIAMEYVDGVNLNDLLIRYAEKDSALPTNISLAIIREACKGLDYAHRKKGFDNKPLNIVHRDISPKNIMISFDGAVKVMDFGIAKAASRDYETRTGVIKGKISYLSPEQVQGARLDKRSDIFSLGIVFYEMLTGTKCFKGESDFSVLFKIKNSDFEPITTVNPTVDPDIAPLVLKALAPNREDRFQTCDELAKEIDRFLSSHNINPAETDISALLQELEQEFRQASGELIEYFPEEGEISKGEVFQLGENGQIPAEIETRIAEENLGIDTSRMRMSEAAPIDEGTQLVSMQPISVDLPARRSPLPFILGGTGLVVLVLIGLFLTGIIPVGQQNPKYQLDQSLSGASSSGTSVATMSFSVEIRSEPSGASVFINDTESKEVTPMTIQGKSQIGDTFEIKIVKECYEPKSEKIVIAKGKIPKKVNLVLDRLIHDVKIESIPSGALLSLDTKEMGTTPLILKQMDGCAAHTLKLTMNDYETVTRTEYMFKQTQEVITLKKMAIPGYALISSTYPVAIFSGSKKLGDTGSDGLKLTLQEGKHSLVALSEKYCIRHSFSVTIEARKSSPVNLSFGKLGYVRINSVPYSEVSVNDFNLGTTPLSEVQLPEGYYDVVWNFVTLNKKKTEHLRIRSNIRQEWKGSIAF
ncbi:serine/threonine protein kinase [bacterium]|nr:serine/threonine protein kinase [bacterium]